MITSADILKAGILIVDDQEANVSVLEEMLLEAGYLSVASTRNPREVCELQQKNRYSLILLDLQMPGMDGFEVMEALHTVESDGYLPVLVITAQPAHKLRALKAGARDFLSKPFDLTEVLARVRNLLEVRLLHTESRRLYAQVVAEQRVSEQLLLRFRAGPAAMSMNTVHGGRIIDVNERYCKFFGYSREELVGRDVLDLNLWANPAERAPIMQRLLKERQIVSLEAQQRHRSGETRDVLASLGLIDIPGESEPVLVSMFIDITARKQAEELLRESEERFRQFAENIQEVFWLSDPSNSRILYVSPAYEKIWGRTCESLCVSPGSWIDSIHDEDRAAVVAWTIAKQSAGSYDQEYRIVRTDGTIRWILDHAFPVRNPNGDVRRVAGVARDVTERKIIERQTLRAQRLESIGTLAGGVAHDLNNALAPILMGLQMLRMQYPANTLIIDTMETSAMRGADMVRQLLTFAKGMEGSRLLIQSRHLFTEVEKIIRGTFPKNIQLKTKHSQKLSTVLGDSTQLHQVLVNLCVNSRDAMPEGGTLTLETMNVEVDASYTVTQPEAKPGAYVLWRVTDTGSGIPVEILDRIFEPFFSTKGPTKGTGFGLSTVLGIVRSHGGFVRVYSVPGEGSAFSIYLPASETKSGDTEFLTKAEVENTFRGHGETILVVDDDPGVRQVTRTMLTGLNFNVITASDGTQALIEVAENRAELRAVITDFHMPHMDGLNFAQVLKHMLPAAGIIVVSGRFEDEDRARFEALGVNALLEKPFPQEFMINALRNIFGEES